MMYGLGVPVVIGPMNGNMTYPPEYRSRSFAERAFVPVARGFADLANYLVPGKAAGGVVVGGQRANPTGVALGLQGKGGNSL